ncbi:STAS domain-containing protein [Micromonospora polyrhachis]|uniref:RsbT antagonist protein RsbS n=1 Tax=Micromonospora polyrhachis TaxID=1282883 RepID=A0A7W7WNR1_9ACTN|nr:STAS domain-containing protein [Micromonospora polyrhachis]MBB4958441.1 rsbT antagonist protein RsbS [Micromonospora polyrhachis]
MDRVPVLKIGDLLLVSIQVDMEDQTALALQEDLAERIVATGCRGVIIDITAMDIVDSFVGRTLSSIAAIARVLDAATVVVGMRPAVAITLVELGLSLDGIRTALNVERAMELLARSRFDEALYLPDLGSDDDWALPTGLDIDRPTSTSS